MTRAGSSIIRRFARAALATVSAAVLLTASPTAAQAASPNTDPSYVVVFNDNIENWMADPAYSGLRLTCNNKYLESLFVYMKTLPRIPDVFTVQQVRNQDQLTRLLTRMETEFGERYAGAIALPNPGSMGYDNDSNQCKKLIKNQQTNAVIWRVGRFGERAEAVNRWRAAGNQSGSCQNLVSSGIATPDRTANVAVRLIDAKAGNRRVVVGSFHWPTGGSPWYGPECADVNIAEASAELNELAVTSPRATLQILGGDANATVKDADWWKDAKALGYKDLVDEDCKRDHGGTACASLPDTSDFDDARQTDGGRRIDYLLAKGMSGFGHVQTINQQNTNNVRYSDHFALTAYIKY